MACGDRPVLGEQAPAAGKEAKRTLRDSAAMHICDSKMVPARNAGRRLPLMAAVAAAAAAAGAADSGAPADGPAPSAGSRLAPATAGARDLSGADFDAAVLGRPELWIVDFYAPVRAGPAASAPQPLPSPTPP